MHGARADGFREPTIEIHMMHTTLCSHGFGRVYLMIEHVFPPVER